MKSILCFGDSNTWGYDPASARRLGYDERWTGILRQQLGAGYYVIEEGLSGRTTVHDDPFEPGRCGKQYLPPCLLTHKPLDLVIIALGTNDMKARFGVPPSDIARGVEQLIQIVRQSDAGIDGKAPQLLIMCPPPVPSLANTPFVEMFAGAEEKSRRLLPHYRQVAEMYGCALLNVGEFVVGSPVDAIHFEADQHRKLGVAVARAVRSVIG